MRSQLQKHSTIWLCNLNLFRDLAAAETDQPDALLRNMYLQLLSTAELF